MTENAKKKYDCATCPYPRYKEGTVIFCDVCMQKLRTIEDKVRAILKKDEEARNDDMVLYLKVCNSYFKDAGAMPFAEVMSQYRYLGLPSFESVGRTRRKLQAEHPELLGSVRIQKLRAKQEQNYRRYAKE